MAELTMASAVAEQGFPLPHSSSSGPSACNNHPLEPHKPPLDSTWTVPNGGNPPPRWGFAPCKGTAERIIVACSWLKSPWCAGPSFTAAPQHPAPEVHLRHLLLTRQGPNVFMCISDPSHGRVGVACHVLHVMSREVQQRTCARDVRSAARGSERVALPRRGGSRCSARRSVASRLLSKSSRSAASAPLAFSAPLPPSHDLSKPRHAHARKISPIVEVDMPKSAHFQRESLLC